MKSLMKTLPLRLAGSALALSLLPSMASADCASSPYLGQVCMMGLANFCPSNTLPADGSLLAISDNQALYALLGTTYGGNGQTTFGLPNLSGRVPVAQGKGASLPKSVAPGEVWGTEQRTLTPSTMPTHSHTVVSSSTLQANTTAGTSALPSASNKALAGIAVQELTGSGVVVAGRWAAPESDNAKTTEVAGLSTTVGATGASQAFDLQPPSLGIRYCVVTQGLFPSQP